VDGSGNGPSSGLAQRERIMRVPLLVVGLVLLFLAASVAVHTRRFVAGAVRAPGFVTGTPAGGSHPIIRFTTASGEEGSFPQGGFVFGYRPGDKVTVIYDPNNPTHRTSLDTVGAIWFFPLLLGGLGVAFVAGALLRSR
jgi:hypothetical protein